MGDASAIAPAICCICCSVTVFIMIMVISGLSILGYNEVGLNYSNWYKTIENETYYYGINYIGLGHEYKTYDIKLSSITFSDYGAMPMIGSRTKDGLVIWIECSLQYKVDPTKIYEIYKRFGIYDYEILQRVILDVVHDVSVQWTSNDFFTKRKLIQIAMKTALQEQVRNKTHHEVVFFQLRSLSLPAKFEKEIQNTEVWGQDIHTAAAEVERENVRFNTSVQVARQAINVTLEAAYGEANKTINEAEAVKSTIQAVVLKQADAFKEMKELLLFDNPAIFGYLKTNLIFDRNAGSGKFAMLMDPAAPS